MRLVMFSGFCSLVVFGVLGLDMRVVEHAYDPAKDYVSAVSISKEPLKEDDVSHICLVRHAPTELSHSVIQGRSMNPSIIVDAQTVSQINYLEAFPWNALYSGSSTRAMETFYHVGFYIRKEVHPSFLFDEQDLGKFEGRGKKEVLRCGEFISMSSDPNYKVDGVEKGKEVLNRFLYGMSEIAKHDKLVGVCTSYCAMNWIFKWATENYKATTSVGHLDVMMFQYSPSTNTYYFIKQKPMGVEEALNTIEF